MSYLPPPINGVQNQPAPVEDSPRPRRLVIFLGVLIPALAIGLTYVWLREPVYQSRATLLTTAPIVIDHPGISTGDRQVVIQSNGNTTSEHVTIQKQTLLGGVMLDSVLQRLHAADAAPALTAAQLQTMLTVTPFPDTNVVELRARGSDDALLPKVVNAWIDAYQELRAREANQAEDNTSEALKEEIARLQSKIENKRQALDQFRRTHDIVTKEDADNQALARLRGLNESLNVAADEEVKAKAHIDAVRDAIARGEVVAPKDERQSLSFLQQRAQELREKLAELRRRYTENYINLQPQLNVIPQQLRQTEKEIAERMAQGQQSEVAAAERAYQAAHQAVQTIRGQIAAHKQEVAEFTTRFAQHSAMEKELVDMENLLRSTQDQLLHLEVTPRNKLPQLSVVDRASQPGAPIWPDYRRDSGIAAGASFVLALFAVWLFEFLTRKPRPEQPPVTPIPNIQVYSVPENVLLARQAESVVSLPEQPRVALEQLPPRELSGGEIRQLLEHAPNKTRQLIAVLLCGLSLDDCENLQADDVDLENRTITVPGHPERTLSIPEVLFEALATQPSMPAWGDCDVGELEALIACAAVDSGVPHPEEITAEAIRHTYIAYLVRQGIRLSELEHVVGPLPAKTLAGYGRLSPPGQGLSRETVQLTHPALRDSDS